MPVGRPSKYSDKLADDICADIAEGKSIRECCEPDDRPSHQTIYNWIADQPGFLDKYVRAKSLQAERMAEEILEIADDATNDWMKRQGQDEDNPAWALNGEHVQRSRLRVDSRKWLMSKLAPKKYGDKLETTHAGEVKLTGIERVIRREKT